MKLAPARMTVVEVAEVEEGEEAAAAGVALGKLYSNKIEF